MKTRTSSGTHVGLWNWPLLCVKREHAHISSACAALGIPKQHANTIPLFQSIKSVAREAIDTVFSAFKFHYRDSLESRERV